ncbi:putative endo-beta-1,4-glucanase D, partial [Leucoagaricus sp. SymC.cos]
IFKTLIADTKTSTQAVRQPQNSSPVHQYASGTDIVCNVNPSPAGETVSMAAGSKIGAADWDGSGQRWFKIAEWGATFNPFTFTSLNQKSLITTIPSNTPSGEYLVRAKQMGLHQPGTPEIFVSCAQIKVTNGGSGNPSKVSIPGYIPQRDKSVALNIYWPVPTNYTYPGPAIWRG